MVGVDEEVLVKNLSTKYTSFINKFSSAPSVYLLTRKNESNNLLHKIK